MEIKARLFRQYPFGEVASHVIGYIGRINQRDQEKLAELGMSKPDIARATLFKGKGCNQCGNTGYRGRGAMMEILLVSDEIREMILKNANANTIREAAVNNGMITLREMGLLRVKEGQTTIEEILRVTSGE